MKGVHTHTCTEVNNSKEKVTANVIRRPLPSSLKCPFYKDFARLEKHCKILSSFKYNDFEISKCTVFCH